MKSPNLQAITFKAKHSVQTEANFASRKSSNEILVASSNWVIVMYW